VPVAGFARLHWLEEGRRDTVAARALVLQEAGCTVALVSVELVLVPGALERAVERKVRDLKLDRLVLAATHTHAGPGGFWRDPLGERLATGPYSDAVFDDLVARISEAVHEAAQRLEPAYLAVARGEARSLVHNRNGAGHEVDGRLVALRLTGLSGKRIADVVVFPSHATVLGLDNRLISGDWPGALMRSRPEPLLFFQGAVGDQTPYAQPGPKGKGPENYARALDASLRQLELGRAEPWPELAVATAETVLPPPQPGATPPFLRRVTANLVYHWFPDRARLTAIRLGTLTLIAVPGEPVAAVGRRWRQVAGEGAEILSLAGDYLGYVETSERMAEMAGETVHTYYGPELADRISSEVKVAAEAVRAPPAATASR
jgi:hypothetical protein